MEAPPVIRKTPDNKSLLVKIALIVLAVVCLLSAASSMWLRIPQPPDMEVLDRATVEAMRSLGWAFWADPEPTNDVKVSRTTLKTLVKQAAFPGDTMRCARLFSKTTTAFALVSGISLFLLSRRVGR